MDSELQNPEAAREVLAAAAMAYSFATDVPRERVLLQTAAASLVSAYPDKPFTEQQAVDAITQHGNLPELRSDLAAQLFAALRSNGLFVPATDPPSALYTIATTFVDSCLAQAMAIDALLDSVARDLFDDLSTFTKSRQPLRDALKSVLSNLMQRFGQQYARYVVGNSRADHPIGHDDLLAFCKQALGKIRECPIAPEKLAQAITELFSSKELHFRKFVFHVIQTYFRLRLLGLTGGLDLLTGDRFRNAEFYLDTNVVITCVIPQSRHHRSFWELLEIAQQLGITLAMTEATIAEFREVAKNQQRDLRAFDTVPSALVTKTRNSFLHGYRASKETAPSLTPEQYLASFDDVRALLAQDWSITVQDLPVEKDIPKADLDRTKKVFADTYLQLRHKPKAPSAVDHDTHLYYLVMRLRRDVSSHGVWVLTLDSSLGPAGQILQGPDATPFSMALDGFLQLISPHVRADHRQSFEDLFIELLQPALMPPEEILTLDDFLMFVDQELSIAALPAEDVAAVIRHVKRALNGQRIRDTEKQKVAYEVQKALADPALKFRLETQKEREHHQHELESLALASQKQKELFDAERQANQAERSAIEAQRDAERTAAASEKARLVDERTKSDEKLCAATEAKGRHTNLMRAVISALVCLIILVATWLAPSALGLSGTTTLIIQAAISLVAILVAVGVATKSILYHIIPGVIAAIMLVLSICKYFFP